MLSKIEPLLLGFSAFLFAYSLDQSTQPLYCLFVGTSVFLYYVIPRKPQSIWIYLSLALFLFLILHFGNYYIPFPFLIPLVLFSVLYPWLREITSVKTPIIALSWTFIMMSAWTQILDFETLIKATVLFLFFLVLAVSSDVKDRHNDAPSLGTIPQIIPWYLLRWALLCLLLILILLIWIWVPQWTLGVVFFSLFSSFFILKNWKQPFALPLDPGLLLFALGNLIDYL